MPKKVKMNFGNVEEDGSWGGRLGVVVRGGLERRGESRAVRWCAIDTNMLLASGWWGRGG
jgi:hypothetical protein